MATNGSSGKSQEIRSKGKWKTTTDLKSNFCSNQHENRYKDGTRKHIVCYCCGYPGHFTQECPRWNGSHIAPLGSSEDPYFLTLNSYQQNVESRYRQDQMSGIITCLICGEEGHYTCDCPMKDQEDSVICTLCSKKGHCCLWCCQQNKSEYLACTRCGEIGHSASTNGLSCSSCDEYHPDGECRMSKVACFICDSQDHYLAQCPFNSALTAVWKDQRENFQAALRLALSKRENTLSTAAKPSTESQVCKPSFAKKSAGKKPTPAKPSTESQVCKPSSAKKSAGKKPKSGKCFSCGEEGHFANGCPSNLKVAIPNKSNLKVRTDNTATRVLKTICLKCNEEGHYANQCPQKLGGTSTNLSRDLEESSTIPTSSNLCKELKEQEPSTARHSSEMKPTSSVVCFSCGEEGHTRRTCRLKHQVLTIDKSSPLVTVDSIPTSNQCSQKRQKR